MNLKLVSFILVMILIIPLSGNAQVPEFKLKFNNRIVQSQYTPFQGKILIKLIAEKHIAIYGNEDEILIISESPFPEIETRYRVDVTKQGKVTINYYRDSLLPGNIPLPLPKKSNGEEYDARTIDLELPFSFKHKQKKVVYVNHRMEITIPYRGNKKWYKDEMKRRRTKRLRK